MQLTRNHINTQISAMINYVQTYYASKLSPFLNPHELLLAQELVASQSDDINMYHYGGYPHAERQRLLLTPDYFEVTQQSFEIQLFEIIFNPKFNKLQHYQILGKLAHLGLERAIFGDIITDGQRWQFLAEKSFTNVLKQEVTQIGSSKVQVQPQPQEQLLAVKNDFTNETIISVSMRLDTVIAAAFKHSRNQVQELIKSGRVFVNWESEHRTDYLVTIGDSISCRGWGRLTILDYLGQTTAHKNKLYLRIFRH
ncbi:YlmH family RNA-binding protein [Bombilactobacillus bombi]|uniref:YlmH family RNA-binding protein n=1 Tax=Bombilactobacillus bombi TaxID=1303590 RepID=UPI0015E5BB9A|nr:YlmH/Sll1252 family protein [Bombilactobacillus bombi]MBA1434349.1 RNA-binding protein [Bombilactobacillus bombi]